MTNTRLRALQNQVNGTLERYVEYVEQIEGAFDSLKARAEEIEARLKTITDLLGTTNIDAILRKIQRLEAENARLRERLGE